MLNLLTPLPPQDHGFRVLQHLHGTIADFTRLMLPILFIEYYLTEHLIPQLSWSI